MFDHDYDGDAVPNANDIMEGFSKPPDTQDQDAYAERPQYIWHAWPHAFTTQSLGIGYAELLAGVVYPLFPRGYRTRHPGDGGTSLDIDIPQGGFSSRFRPGYAVTCLEETYKPLGLVALVSFTRAERRWEDVRAWYRRVTDRVPKKLPAFDSLEHQRRAFAAARAYFEDPVELAALEELIDGLRRTRVALRAWAGKRITEARKAQASGFGRIAPSDRDLDWMVAAGIRIPKFMAEYSEREDLPTTDETQKIEEAETDSAAVQQSLALMQEMAAAFTRMADTRQPEPAPDTRVADLERRLDEQAALFAKQTELLTQLLEQKTAPDKAPEQKPKAPKASPGDGRP